MNEHDFVTKFGFTPQYISEFTLQHRVKLTEFARMHHLNIRSLLRAVHILGIEHYKTQTQSKMRFTCLYCGKEFLRYESQLKGDRTFCSRKCSDRSREKDFEDCQFRFDLSSYAFMKPSDSLGDYSAIDSTLSDRQIQNLVAHDNCDSTFFSKGIQSEARAYIFGLFLTDGNITASTKNRKFPKYVIQIRMEDEDIIRSVHDELRFKTAIGQTDNGKYSKAAVTNAHLFHDLSMLGCTTNKTEVANYPELADNLDRHFIRGVIDGDGSWIRRQRGDALELKFCGNDRLLYGIYLKIKQHVGVTPSSLDYPSDYNPTYLMKTYCTLVYNKAAALQIRDWVYQKSTLYGARKFKAAYSVDQQKGSITTAELCAMLGCSHRFITPNIRKYQLPHVREGNNYRFSPEQVDFWCRLWRERQSDQHASTEEIIERLT
ncbi:helix-turn-helix domain-containing protein [Priestia sp. BR_2]